MAGEQAAVLTVYVGPSRGGCYERLQRLVKALAARRVVVHYVGPAPQPFASPFMRFHEVATTSLTTTTGMLFRACRRAGSVAWSEGIRSIFCFGSIYAALLSPLRLRPGTRLVTFLRGDVVEEQRAGAAPGWRLGLVWAADRLGRLASHRLVAVSSHLLGATPGAVVCNDAPAAVDRTPPAQARNGLGLPAEAPIVGYCGAVVPAKSLETLVDAMADLDGAHLAVLGFRQPPSPYEMALAGRAEKRLAHRWHGLPWSAEAERFLDALDVFVLPSRSEGSSNALLEALSRGVPCLGARRPGLVGLLEDEDLLFPWGDAASLRSSLAALLADPERRCRFSGLALERAARRRFDWEAEAVAALDEGLGGRLSIVEAA